MALKEYIGLARLTQAFSLLKSKLDGKEDTPTVISYDDFMELTPEQQMTGSYIVVGGTPMTDAYGISYKTNKTVGDALDDHADAIDELNADKFGDFITTSDVTISNVTYHTYWEVAPTASNQVYGVAVHPTNGKLYRIYNNKGAYSAYSYDTNTITGEGIKTKVAKTGTAQSAITDTISASTTLDNAIGTLLNNDATLNADLNSRITTNLTATANVIMIDSPVSVIIMNKIAFVSANINKVSTTDGAALINNMPAPKQKVVVPIVGDNVSGRGYINANDTTLNSYTFGAGWFSFNVCYEVA